MKKIKQILMIKTLIPHNYNIGSTIYIDRNILNYNLIDTR